MRVLKPGGHLLAFGGSRTWHRLAVAIEDAGFEMRDSIAWLYGSGFPKSMDVSKAIDKAAGIQGEKVGERTFGKTSTGQNNGWNTNHVAATGKQEVFAPATPEAQKWEGWGTALKPAFEPVVVARKPFAKGSTVAANVLVWGTGGLNIDASRIGTDTITTTNGKGFASSFGGGVNDNGGNTHQGRWPANIILDPYTAELLDEQSGNRPSAGVYLNPDEPMNVGSRNGIHNPDAFMSDFYFSKRKNTYAGEQGGASRFFYVAKASKRDRNEGLDHLEVKRPDERTEAGMGSFAEKGVQPGRNFHPTVKPTSLMRYLIKLVTPPNGTVLDPFTGSGSTGKAAILEGFNFVGIELTEDYLPIIKGRLEHAEATLNADATEQEQEQKETLF